MKNFSTLFNCLPVLVLLLAFYACSDRKGINDILSRAENIVEQQPDSALALLNSIQNPYELNVKQYAEYTLHLVQLKDKTYKNITSDTLIFMARDYFKKKNDLNNLTLSEFYCGRVLQSQGKVEEAMKSYLETKGMAEKINDIYLRGLVEFYIGGLNYDIDQYDEAVSHYQSALNYFSQISDSYKKLSAVYSCIGNSFLLENSSDSAFYYYQKGLDLAKSNNDSIRQIDIMQNMGVSFLKIGKVDSAKKMTIKAMELCSDNNQKAKLYLNLAKIYYQENKKDSALYYSDLALSLSGDEKSLNASIYKLISKTEESIGNYQKSLYYHQFYTKCLISILDEKENDNILEVQKKYDFELLQNANRKLIIERLWLSILSIIAFVIFSFSFYRNRILNREALLIAGKQIYQLKELSAKNNEIGNSISDTAVSENNNKLRNILLKQLDVFKKISLLEHFLKEDEKENGRKILKKVNEIMYNSENSFDWEIFYQPVNALHENFLIRLTNSYPELDKEDIIICCLSKIGFNNTEIALLVNSNQNIIQKRKTVIREKTGMKKQENFVKQLDCVFRRC